MRHLLLIAVTAALPLLVACETTVEDRAANRIENTPLHFDPTEESELHRWWSNGKQMLRLDETRSYALFADTNRYHPPVERGSWSRLSYAEIRFTPYDTSGETWVRVTISKDGDRLALGLSGLEPMFAIDAPPHVLEDDLVGTWEDASGTLALRASGRYGYSSRLSGGRTIVAGHGGRWRVEDEVLRLAPDPPTMSMIGLRIQFDEARLPIVLESVSWNFRRPEPTELSP